jgi:hypothetical protein
MVQTVSKFWIPAFHNSYGLDPNRSDCLNDLELLADIL